MSVLSVLPVSAVAHAQGTGEGQDIIVTASAFGDTAGRMTTPVLALSGEALVHRRQSTLGETLAGQPGIHFDSFGGGAGRPVIRGQASPRVEALSDGASIRDASSISPDHAVAAEPLLLRGIEVLRGPATLLYGGGAIGGAVNLLDDKVPTRLPEGGIAGGVEARMGTADRERALVGGVTVAAGPFAFRAEGVERHGDDYRVPARFGSRRVDNSFTDSRTFTLGTSWIGEGGYLGVAWTRQRSKYGLPGHSHEYEGCHPHDQHLHCGVSDDDDHHGHAGDGHGDHGHDHDDDHGGHDHGHDSDLPFVKLRSDRFDIRSEWRDPLPGVDRVRLRMAATDYEHDELEDGAVKTTFRNRAHDIRFELAHKPVGGLRGVVGVQHSSSRFSALGEEAFLPRSETTNTALFLMEKVELGPVRLEMAARQEWQAISAFGHEDVTHRPFSMSAAAIWDMGDGYSVAVSAARSQRAPSAQELFADGVHLATNTFELGNADLGKETARSVDLTLRRTSGATTFTVGAYHQHFSNFIYARTLDRFEDFRLIQYIAADAQFTGVDAEVRHQLTPELGLTLFGDFVRARLADGRGNLPRIPPGRIGGRVEAEKDGFLFEAEFYRAFAQKRIAELETATGGYNMLNATAAYHMDLGGRHQAEIFLRGTNLTNSLAYNHASFIKDAAPFKGRNIVLGVRTEF